MALIIAILSYLLGSIATGYILGLCAGVDVRKTGSGNIGATNVGRILGKKAGYLCLVLDILKGLLPALAALFLLNQEAATHTLFTWWALVALAPIFGHVFPIFLGFRGGKGVATTIGASLGVFPYLAIPILISLLGYLAVRKLSGFVSLGSLTIAAVFPVAALVLLLTLKTPTFEATWPLGAAALVMSVLIVVRHRENIARLRQEKELRN